MFVDRSDLIVRNDGIDSRGIAIVDIDGDHAFEIVAAGVNGPNRVWKWVAGSLRDITPRELADERHRTIALAAGDIDGDGIEELYAVHASGDAGADRIHDRLFKRQLDHSWSDVVRNAALHLDSALPAAANVVVVDRRGVGRYAFAVGGPGRPLSWYEHGPHGQVVDLANALGLSEIRSVNGLLAAPLFQGRLSLVCTVDEGPNALYVNRGDGTFEERSDQLGVSDSAENSHGPFVLSACGVWALGWGNVDGPHRLLAPDEQGIWRDRATPAFAFPSALHAVVVADFDNDGTDEVFIHNDGEPNRLFRLGTEPRCELNLAMLDPGAALEPLERGTGVAVADVDGDGVLELVLAHASSRSLTLYKAASASGNCWLRIRPLTRFGAPARGATVRVRSGLRSWSKVIECGGTLGQVEPVAHFGMQPQRRFDSVTIVWPDGASISFEKPDINCTYVVEYPCG